MKSQRSVRGGTERVLRPSSVRKRAVVLEAAEHVFLRDGFADANLDEVTRRSGVSKQTVYAHFGSKEALFEAAVTRSTTAAADAVHLDVADPVTHQEVPEHLQRWARTQLDTVLDPKLLALRRLVIAEAVRFPQLARAFWEGGPLRAMEAMAERFARLTARGLLTVDDAAAAARTFNWLVMAEPLNAVMMLGDEAIPTPEQRFHLVEEAVRVFLSAYTDTQPDAVGSDGVGTFRPRARPVADEVPRSSATTSTPNSWT